MAVNNKKTDAKATQVKPEAKTAKPVETKAAAKETTPVKTEETKRTVAKETAVKKAAPAKKDDAKKAPAKKKPFSKKDIPYTVAVEHAGNQVMIEDIKPRVIEAWQKAGNRVRDIKNIDLYIKPEENKVYFVVNGDFSDGVDLF